MNSSTASAFAMRLLYPQTSLAATTTVWQAAAQVQATERAQAPGREPPSFRLPLSPGLRVVPCVGRNPISAARPADLVADTSTHNRSTKHFRPLPEARPL